MALIQLPTMDDAVSALIVSMRALLQCPYLHGMSFLHASLINLLYSPYFCVLISLLFK
jgi:hypothetical protein